MVHAKQKQLHRFQQVGAGWKALVVAGCMAAMGVGSAAGQNCTDFTPGDFKKTALASGLDQPMKMAVAKDGRVFFNQRSGAMRMLKPGNTTPVTVKNFVVANGSGNEDGLLGFALDPKFESNQFMYMFYTPASPMGYRISRFTLVGDSLNNEKILLTIPHLFSEYGPLIIHGAGAVAFDPSGNLLVTTGDLMITNGTGAPTPTDQNSGTYDAQKTSANTNSYLGKVLRIKPTDDGGYTIPEGNLFAKGTDKTLPEIYAMGLRNPFTMTVDPKTGDAYVGEVGPDGAGGTIPSQDEVNQIKAPGNFGWPYLTGDNQAYPGFSADKLTNNSKNNTGIAELPAPIKSLFWMGTAKSSPIAGFIPKSGNVGSRCIKVGGFYRFNPSGANASRLPPYFDNGLFVANHNQFDSTEGIRFFKLTETGDLSAIKVFQPTSRLPMSFEIGPDGVLYVVEWGKDNGHWFNQKDGRILKVEYTGTCSATAIKRMTGALAASFANSRPIHPGQAFEFPVGAVSADIHDLAGKKIMNLRKAAGTMENTLRIAKQDGILLARFKVD